MENKKIEKKMLTNSKIKLNKLNCFYANARSVVNKLEELELYVHEEKPHIIGITETWGNSKIENSEISFDGYQTFRKDRKDRIGGGVLLYIRNDIKAVRREIFENIEAETIWCEIFIGGEGTLIGVSYRSPTSTVEEDKILFQMIENTSGKKLMLMGDFNFGNINWVTHEACAQSKNFLDCINDNFLHQHVHQITRGKIF